METRSLEIARRTQHGVIARPDALPLRFVLPGVVARDNHELLVEVETPLRVAQGPGDLETFAQQFLATQPIVTLGQVGEKLEPALRHAVVALARNHDAADLVDADANRRHEIATRLLAGLQSTAFGLSVELTGLPDARIASPSLDRARAQQRADAVAAERFARQQQRLSQLASLLDEFSRARASAPDLTTRELLARLPADDRASLASHAWQLDASKGAVFEVIGGNTLLRIDVASDGPVASAQPIDESLGPVRSLNDAALDERRVRLIGARDGVLLDDAETRVAFRAPSHGTPNGFNAAAVDPSARRLYATHSALGLVGWSLNAPDRVDLHLLPDKLSGDGSPRHLLLGGAVLVACGGRVLAVEPGVCRSLDHGGAPVLLLAADERRTLVARADGSVQALDESLRVSSLRPPGRSIVAATVLRGQAGAWLVLADASGAVECVRPDDGIAIPLGRCPRGVSMLAAGAGTIAVVSADRTHLSFIHPHETGRTVELPAFSQLR
ncbi:MAG TPA: hypothetical protein PKB10_15070, partial [Tepidisphaeraceae bacterium]|nr:hypothetical protein [Tepidisphaeraceae bacterium]